MRNCNFEPKVIDVESLIPFRIRDIREDVLERLVKRIEEAGYNPARPLTVVQTDEGFHVADGNHRLEAAKKHGITSIPCVVYKEESIYRLAVEGNTDEDTYAPMDLFDWLDVIQKLQELGWSQERIGAEIGWSREKVKNHVKLLDSIGTEILVFAKQHQEGRVPIIGTAVPNDLQKTGNSTFNFTEWWFRDSGLYDLDVEHQEMFMLVFERRGFKMSKRETQQETTKLKMWQKFEATAKEALYNESDLPELQTLIRNGVFKTEKQLMTKIDDYNRVATNKLICGDCLNVLEDIEDCTIDVVITDPPYGINYMSNFSKNPDHVTKQGLLNDDENAPELFDKTCEVLSRKTKPDAHLYFFIDFKNFPAFKAIAEKYFKVRTPLVWHKSDAGIGSLEYDYINGTELVIYCTKGEKKLKKRRVNVFEVPRLHSDKMIHPTQKPPELIREILDVSAQKNDTICDPFMGSGSHIKAAKEYGDLTYIGIELDELMFEKAKAFILDEQK